MHFLDRLSPDEKQILLNYQAITGCDDLEGAAARLEAHAWDLEVAVQTFFDPSAAQSFSSTHNNIAGASSSSSSAGGAGLGRSASSSSISSGAHALRADLPPEHQDSANAPLLPTASAIGSSPSDRPRLRSDSQRPQRPTLLALFTTPLQWGFKFIWAILTYTLSLFPFLGIGGNARRRATRRGASSSSHTQRDGSSRSENASTRFREDFVASYGPKHPNFHPGTYTQALDSAKRDIKYFLAVLQSDEHDDTPKFSRDTLASDVFINFLSERNIVVWGGDVKETEAYKVSLVLSATAYPFMALIMPQGSNMVVACRFEGLAPTDQIIQKMRRVMDRFDPQLVAARADRASRDAARSIREQQDAAYQASLRADQEKARMLQAELERERLEQQERDRQQREKEAQVERRKQRKLQIAQEMPPEPSATSTTETTRLSIRLPDGRRIVRRFYTSDSVQLLWNFIETHDLSPLTLETDFVIVNPYPRRLYTDMAQSLRDAGLVPSASVVVEEKIDDGI